MPARAVPGPGWRTYELTTTIDLSSQTGPGTVWLPLTGDDGVCQKGLRRTL